MTIGMTQSDFTIAHTCYARFHSLTTAEQLGTITVNRMIAWLDEMRREYHQEPRSVDFREWLQVEAISAPCGAST